MKDIYQDPKIKALLDRTDIPDHVKQAAETIAVMKFENENLRQQVARLAPQHKKLFATLITIVHACPNHEMRIHRSHFLRFKDEYALTEEFDQETHEHIFQVKGLTEELPKDAPEPERDFYTLPEMIMLLEKMLKTDRNVMISATIEKFAASLREISKQIREERQAKKELKTIKP